MDTRSVYHDSAASALYLARRTANLSDKQHLLMLAEKWLALAERVASRTGDMPTGQGGPVAQV